MMNWQLNLIQVYQLFTESRMMEIKIFLIRKKVIFNNYLSSLVNFFFVEGPGRQKYFSDAKILEMKEQIQ